MMNPEIKLEWIEQLESGTIPQGQGNLGNPDGSRCCLGVLCDIAVRYGVIPMPKVIEHPRLYYVGQDTMPPFEVEQWAGINSPDIGIILALVKMNDRGQSFLQIAQVIREEL